MIEHHHKESALWMSQKTVISELTEWSFQRMETIKMHLCLNAQKLYHLPFSCIYLNLPPCEENWIFSSKTILQRLRFTILRILFLRQSHWSSISVSRNLVSNTTGEKGPQIPLQFVLIFSYVMRESVCVCVCVQ